MSIESMMPSNHFTLCHPFSSCLQSFTASGSFPVSQFFASGGQSIGVSTSASVLSMNIQDWFPLGWTGWISLQIRWFYVTSLTHLLTPFSSLSGSPLYDAGRLCFVLLIHIECSIWHLCFLTRDQTHASFSRSTDFQPLGKSQMFFFFLNSFL